MRRRHPGRRTALGLTISLALGTFTSSCQGGGTDGPRTVRYVSEFVSTSDAATGLFRGTSVSLEVHRDDGEIRVLLNGDCNHISSSVRPQDGRLVVDEIAVTELGCHPRERHLRHEWIVELLESGPLWEQDGDRLLLTSADDPSNAIDFARP